MGEVRGPEGLFEIGRNAGGVPYDQAGQQRPRVRGEPVGGRPQPRAEPGGGLLERRRPPDDVRRPVRDADDGRDPVAVVRGRRQPPGDPQPGGGQQPEPVGPGDEQDGGPGGCRGRGSPVSDHHAGRLPLDHDGRNGAGRPTHVRPDGPRVLGHRDVQRGLRVPGRQPRHRPAPGVGRPQRAGRGTGGSAEQRGGGGRGGGPGPCGEGGPQGGDGPCPGEGFGAGVVLRAGGSRPAVRSPAVPRPRGDQRRQAREGQRHHAGHGHRAAVRRQRGGGSRPRGERGGHQAQVRGEFTRGPVAASSPHGWTMGRRSAKRRAPIPLTWRRSDTERKPPCSVR